MPARAFHCAACGGGSAYRSRPRNLLEKLMLPLLGMRPVRCGHCYRRSYQTVFRAGAKEQQFRTRFRTFFSSLKPEGCVAQLCRRRYTCG
jgi:hypothetical protein